jgi:hypothetical protein
MTHHLSNYDSDHLVSHVFFVRLRVLDVSLIIDCVLVLDVSLIIDCVLA